MIFGLLALIKASAGEAAAISINAIDFFCVFYKNMRSFMLDGNAMRNSVTLLLEPQNAATKDNFVFDVNV